MESNIGWLRNSTENTVPYDHRIITNLSGEPVSLTPEQLEQIIQEDDLAQLIQWGGFKTVQEAEDFIKSELEAI